MACTGRLSPLKYEENLKKDLEQKTSRAFWIAGSMVNQREIDLKNNRKSLERHIEIAINKSDRGL